MAVDYAALKKGGFMRQKQKNYFSLRIRVAGGNLNTAQLAAITEAAEKYGRGRVHLTSRQSLEIPFINEDDIEEVKAVLAKGGAEPGASGPRVRTVTACQGNEICASGNIDTYTLAKEIDERYFGRDLPHKFKFGITGCQNNCLKAEENDLGIKGASVVSWKEESCIFCGACERVCRENAIKIEENSLTVAKDKCISCGRCEKICPKDAWDSESGYIVSFGGLFGNKINKGECFLPIIKDKETLFKITDAAIKFFEENAKPKERFKYTAERFGWDKFKDYILEVYNG